MNKEQRKILAGLRAQGAEVTQRTHGWLVKTEKGTTMIPGTPSDYRSMKNTRSDIRRLGLRWPLDGRGTLRQRTAAQSEAPNEKDTPMTTTDTPDIYGIYATRPNKPTRRHAADVLGAVEWLEREGRPLMTNEIVNLISRKRGRNVSTASIQNALYWFGYRAVPGTEARYAAGWRFVWHKSEEPTQPIAVQPTDFVASEDLDSWREEPTPESLAAIAEEAEDDEPVVDPVAALIAEAHPEFYEQPEPEAEPYLLADNAWDVDPWTLPGDLTLDAWRRAMMASGVKTKVVHWR